MKAIIKRTVVLLLIFVLFVTGGNTNSMFCNVFAESEYGLIADKGPDLLYGEQLKNRENSISYDLYSLMLDIDMDTTEVLYVFETPVELAGTNRDEVMSQNFELLKSYSNDIQTMLDAFIKDFPETFWIDYNSITSSSSFSYTTYSDGTQKWTLKSLKINIPKLTSITESEYNQVFDRLNAIVDAVGNYSVYNKLKYYHDYLCKNIVYDLTAENAHNIYGALCEGKAVCEGYAESFKVLCDLSGIPCVSVLGKAGATSESLEDHLWNYCKMEDGKWYAVDATWDDQPNLVPPIIYDYFLCGSESYSKHMRISFSNSHISDGDFSYTDIYTFTYPELSVESYEYNPRKTPLPTAEPTEEPTVEPTATPTAEPTEEPTVEPTATPTAEPTEEPTVEPTATPTAEPTEEPTVEPTATPTVEPTEEPTAEPTEEPTVEPTATPTVEPTEETTVEPTAIPTAEPTEEPTEKPTERPTILPTMVPIPSVTAIPSTKEPLKFILGDVDCDTRIDSRDALEILKIAAKLRNHTEDEKLSADVDGNLKIDATDALNVLKFAAKIIDKFPCEE